MTECQRGEAKRWRLRFTEETDTWHKKVAGFSWCRLISTPRTCRNSTSGITRNIYRNCCRCPAFSQRPATRRSRVARSTWHAMKLESVAVMQTLAFTNRPRTPWGQKVSPSVIGKNLTRIVGEQIYPDGVEMPERGMAPVLQIGRMSVPAEVDAEWNAWYSREYVLSGSPGYQRLQHGLRICQHGRARKPGVEGATATFLAQFAAHAAGHDACTGFCRGVRTGQSIKSRVRSRHWGRFSGGAGSARVNPTAAMGG
jgi:hypothetical protein